MKYNTKQKDLIYNYFLLNKKNCVTAYDIKDYLKEQKIGLTTIYRYLDILQKEELIRKYTNEYGQSATFEFIDNKKNCDAHYHLKCTSCNTIIHLECDVLKNMETHIKDTHQFKVNPLKTVIYGLCYECAKKQ